MRVWAKLALAAAGLAVAGMLAFAVLRERPSEAVAAYFTWKGDSLPAAPRPAIRRVSESNVESALRELIKGPTLAEQAQGFTSDFSSRTANMLISVQITAEGRAIVNFADIRQEMKHAGTTAGTGQLLRELSYTIFQFPEIQEAEFQLNGNCNAFWEWLQAVCQIVPADRFRSVPGAAIRAGIDFVAALHAFDIERIHELAVPEQRESLVREAFNGPGAAPVKMLETPQVLEGRLVGSQVKLTLRTSVEYSGGYVSTHVIHLTLQQHGNGWLIIEMAADYDAD